jgi:hypothetical protein
MTDIPSMDELTQFGVRPADEHQHPFDADDPTWNESLFYDWYTDDGRLAGHVRLGCMPGQRRVWLWVYLFDGARWVAVDEARLPISGLDWDTFTYDNAGLRFERQVVDELLHNKVRVSAFGRVIAGPGVGRVLPVTIDLDVFGIGACHSVGDTGVDGHSHGELSAARFEQPTRVTGHFSVGGERFDVVGRGERDHSWGPRMWNMEWRFLVLNGETFRRQAVAVSFGEGEPDEDALVVGYSSDASGTSDIDSVRFELRYADDAQQPFEGRVRARYENGAELAGSLTCVSAAEIDATHVFSPPQPSRYQRALVRYTPDDGSAPCLGWLEINRFLQPVVFEGDE